MLPYTSEIMEDYIGVLALCEMDEVDSAPGDKWGARKSLWRGDAGALKGLRWAMPRDGCMSRPCRGRCGGCLGRVVRFLRGLASAGRNDARRT